MLQSDAVTIATMVGTTYQARLNEAMAEAGVDTSTLAARLGVSYQAIRKAQDGRTKSLTAANNAAAAAILGVSPDWLATGAEPKRVPVSSDASSGAAAPPAGNRQRVAWHPVIAWETPSDLPDNEFALVSRRAVKLAAGDGKMVFEDEELPPLPFRADWLRGRRVTKHSNLVIVYAEGDSMEPDIRDGDAVLLDMGQREVVDGQVYAIDYGGHLRVKRLQKRWDGGLIIISDNAAKHPSESLSADDASHIAVLGRVIWRGGSV